MLLKWRHRKNRILAAWEWVWRCALAGAVGLVRHRLDSALLEVLERSFSSSRLSRSPPVWSLKVDGPRIPSPSSPRHQDSDCTAFRQWEHRTRQTCILCGLVYSSCLGISASGSPCVCRRGAQRQWPIVGQTVAHHAGYRIHCWGTELDPWMKRQMHHSRSDRRRSTFVSYSLCTE